MVQRIGGKIKEGAGKRTCSGPVHGVGLIQIRQRCQAVGDASLDDGRTPVRNNLATAVCGVARDTRNDLGIHSGGLQGVTTSPTTSGPRQIPNASNRTALAQAS
jgi:hypothetical protein